MVSLKFFFPRTFKIETGGIQFQRLFTKHTNETVTIIPGWGLIFSFFLWKQKSFGIYLYINRYIFFLCEKKETSLTFTWCIQFKCRHLFHAIIFCKINYCFTAQKTHYTNPIGIRHNIFEIEIIILKNFY